MLALLIAVVMAVVVKMLDILLAGWLGSGGQMIAILRVAITVPVGVLVYLLLSYKTGLLKAVLGERTDDLMRKFRLKK